MSIWFAEVFAQAELCKDGRRMGALSEEFGDGRLIDSLGRVAHPWRSGGPGWLEIHQKAVVGDGSNGGFGGWFSCGRLKRLLKWRF